MITVATLVRDPEYIHEFSAYIERYMPCEYELVIGDNSTNENIREALKILADEYIYISDKQLFRMGIPWAHNLINSIANTYKIMYFDSDEYPVWINPEIEQWLDFNYIIPALRFDFFTSEEIDKISNITGYTNILEECGKKPGIQTSIQDRIYNSRYVQFDGVCHSVFHAPQHFRAQQAGAIYLHNETVRNTKDKDRMDKLIDEQFAKQNINFMLASSEVTLKWGKGVTHKFEDWKKWNEAYKSPKNEV